MNWTMNSLFSKLKTLMSPTLNRNIIYLKSSILEKALSTFVIIAG